jgi:hypothetical protein
MHEIYGTFETLADHVKGVLNESSCLNNIIPRLEKPVTQPIQSGLWTLPFVAAHYSKDCCNTVLYCNKNIP